MKRSEKNVKKEEKRKEIVVHNTAALMMFTKLKLIFNVRK